MTNAIPSSDNIVPMVNKIMEEGAVSQELLAKKRQIALRSFEITARQLEVDAGAMEQSAILGEHDMKRRHELFRTAEALRVAQGWLTNLFTPAPEEPHATN